MVAVGASAVGDETVGVVLAVDAAVIVGVTVDAAVTVAAAACAVDAVSVAVGVSAAAELQTFPGDAASVAARQVNHSDCLSQVPSSSAHAAAAAAPAAAAAAVEAPSGVVSGAAQGQAVSGGVANDRDGVSAALAAAVSCKGFLPGAGRAGLQYAVDDLGADEAHLAGSAQGALEEGSGHLWVGLLGS